MHISDNLIIRISTLPRRTLVLHGRSWSCWRGSWIVCRPWRTCRRIQRRPGFAALDWNGFAGLIWASQRSRSSRALWPLCIFVLIASGRRCRGYQRWSKRRRPKVWKVTTGHNWCTLQSKAQRKPKLPSPASHRVLSSHLRSTSRKDDGWMAKQI